MASHPQVFALLEEILDSGKTPEEVCSTYPDLLPEVRRRWQEFCLIDGQIAELLPGLRSGSRAATAPPGAGLPQIPGYDVEAVLGHGGMGVVFKARQLRLNRTVALKMALTGAFAGPHERERFQREAEAVAALRHANVVQIHDVGEADGRPYFSMEYVEGGSLAENLDGTPRPARDAAMLVATLARAVQAAHTSGVVHRDLKPGNVLLTVDGIPKISDFGLARKLSGDARLTQTGAAVGTPSYMAPEQARGRPDAIGPAVDIYALGAILYELLTGRPPFRGATPADTVQLLLDHDAVRPSRLNGKLPADLETICLKCLHKEPQWRYVTAGALADDLDRFHRGEAIAARPEGALGRLIRSVRRRPALSAAVAVSVVLALVLAGGGLWLLSDRAATVRAAEVDLAEMVQSLRDSAWARAAAARDRAKGRLRDGGPNRLRQLVDQGRHDLDLASGLDAIRLEGAGTVGGVNAYANVDERYVAMLREAGLGTVEKAVDPAVEWFKGSNIRNALIAALDHWSVCTRDPTRRIWILEVARKADSDPTGWRTRARDPDARKNQTELQELIRTAPIKDAPVSLLLALEMSLEGSIAATHTDFLKEVQQEYPADFWVNCRLAFVLVADRKSAEAVGFYQAALTIRPDSPMVHNNLGRVLGDTERHKEALVHFRRAATLDPTADLFQVNFARGLGRLGQHEKAVEQLEAALQMHPDSTFLLSALGNCLDSWGQPARTFTAYSRVVELEPARADYRKDLRMFLVRQRRLAEARIQWQAELASDPPEHDAWYGYAELCLFLGEVEEYLRARTIMLEKFSATTDPQIAERTARACLLLPAPEGELHEAVALADRALSANRSKYRNIFPAFEFVKGLAEYREGRLEPAIAAMTGDASRVVAAAPRLILAMALFRKGDVAQAKQQLMAAVLSYDWKPGNVHEQDGCICHVLRREAENLILPNLPQFLEGKYQPQTNDERLALVGICQFLTRTCAAARLYADAFAADSTLAANFRAGYRYQAACHATQAGCGRGTDAASLDEQERACWRAQAKEWLQADLTDWRRTFETDPTIARALQQRLGEWRSRVELVCIRDRTEIEKLPADERHDWLALWDDVAALLTRSQPAK